MYELAHTIPVPGIYHQTLRGRACHLNTFSEVDALLSSSMPVAVNPGDFPYAPSGGLILLSNLHGRSHELPVYKVFNSKQKKVKTSVSLKGGNFCDLKIEEDNITPSGYRINGMQDSDALLRCIIGGDILDNEGADVEQIVRVFEPSHFPYKGNLITKEVLMNILIDEFLRTYNVDVNGKSRNEHEKRLSKYAKDTAFIITARSMGVGERLADFTQLKSSEDFTRMLLRAFEYINAVGNIKYINIGNKEDILYFFTDLLPLRIAENFAVTHKKDLVIKYSHTGNITTVGGICDLDSLRGSILGLKDLEPSPTEKNHDIELFMRQDKAPLSRSWSPLPEIIHKLESLGLMPESSMNLPSTVTNNFYNYYLAQFERDTDIARVKQLDLSTSYILTNPKTKIEYYQELIENLGDPREKELIKFLPVLYNEFITMHSYKYVHLVETSINRIEKELGVSIEVPASLWFGNLINSFIETDTNNFVEVVYNLEEIEKGRDSEAVARFVSYINNAITEHVKAQLDKVLLAIKAEFGEKTSDMILNLYADRELLYMEKHFAQFPDELETFERSAFVRHRGNINI